MDERAILWQQLRQELSSLVGGGWITDGLRIIYVSGATRNRYVYRYLQCPFDAHTSVLSLPDPELYESDLRRLSLVTMGDPLHGSRCWTQ